MKLHKFTFISLLFLFANYSMAEPCGTSVGNTVIGKVTLQCLKVTGTATFSDTTIVDKLTLFGNLNASSSTLNNIDVTGNVALENTSVSGATVITGKLDALGSKLNDIELNGESITLTSSTTGNIIIHSNRANATPEVDLSNNSVVNGNITFANGNGIVKSYGSKITGTVTGGKLEQ